MSHYVVGIDGGGTKTSAAIVDSMGRLCGIGHGGPSNLDDVSPIVIQASITQAIQQACQRRGLTLAHFDAAFLGMAGVVSPSDRQAIRNIAEALQLAPPERIGIDHDCRIALAGGLSGRPGIVLIVGTGSSCFGMNTAGESWRAGGWGHLISDEGSGYWLGLHAMKIAVAAFDGRAAPTPLMERMQRQLGLVDMNDIMHRLYVIGLSRAEIAALAPLTLEAAAAGDQAAMALIQRGTQDLADCVLAVAQRLGLADKPEVALVGGLFQAGEIFVQPLREAMLNRLPGCRSGRPELPPALGACVLALQALNVSVDERLACALRQDVEELGMS